MQRRAQGSVFLYPVFAGPRTILSSLENFLPSVFLHSDPLFACLLFLCLCLFLRSLLLSSLPSYICPASQALPSCSEYTARLTGTCIDSTSACNALHVPWLQSRGSLRLRNQESAVWGRTLWLATVLDYTKQEPPAMLSDCLEQMQRGLQQRMDSKLRARLTGTVRSRRAGDVAPHA